MIAAAFNFIFWWTGALLWCLGGLGFTAIFGLIVVEFVTRRIGMYVMLCEGIKMAQTARRQRKILAKK